MSTLLNTAKQSQSRIPMYMWGSSSSVAASSALPSKECTTPPPAARSSAYRRSIANVSGAAARLCRNAGSPERRISSNWRSKPRSCASLSQNCSLERGCHDVCVRRTEQLHASQACMGVLRRDRDAPVIVETKLSHRDHLHTVRSPLFPHTSGHGVGNPIAAAPMRLCMASKVRAVWTDAPCRRSDRPP